MAVARVQINRQEPDRSNNARKTAANANEVPRYKKVARIPKQNSAYTTTDQLFNDTYEQAGVMSQSDTRNNINRVERQYVNQPQEPQVYQPSRVPTVHRKKVNHKKSAAYKAGKLFARARVSGINAWVGGWAIFWYFTFQLPLAALSLAGLGVMVTVYASITAIPGGKYALVVVESVTKVAADTIGQAIRFFADRIFGIEFDPVLIFITPFALTFLLGLMQLILTWFIYSLAGIKSLTGEGGGIKSIMFVFAGIGYVIPVLNLFPLIFLWMAVVWKYPK